RDGASGEAPKGVAPVTPLLSGEGPGEGFFINNDQPPPYFPPAALVLSLAAAALWAAALWLSAAAWALGCAAARRWPWAAACAAIAACFDAARRCIAAWWR